MNYMESVRTIHSVSLLVKLLCVYVSIMPVPAMFHSALPVLGWWQTGEVMPEVIGSQHLQVRVPTKQRSSPSISRAPWLMNNEHVCMWLSMHGIHPNTLGKCCLYYNLSKSHTSVLNSVFNWHTVMLMQVCIYWSYIGKSVSNSDHEFWSSPLVHPWYIHKFKLDCACILLFAGGTCQIPIQ